MSKAGQLEAAALDSELSEMLKDDLNRVLVFFRPSLLSDIQPELDAFFRSMVYYFSVWTNHPTPGNVFQNLHYVDARYTQADPYDLVGQPLSRGQRVQHGLISVLLPWFWARLTRFFSVHEWGARSSDDWRRKVWLLSNRLESLYKCATLINFCVFLVDGRYRCLGDRLLKFRLLHTDPSRIRSLNFEFMNQLLVWQSFIQFLGVVKPMVSSSVIKEWLSRLWSRSAAAASPAKEAACPICLAEPIDSPHVGDCGHRYCYFCLMSAIMKDKRYACARCGTPISRCQRAEPTVVMDQLPA